jgi:hypothetical protein
MQPAITRLLELKGGASRSAFFVFSVSREPQTQVFSAACFVSRERMRKPSVASIVRKRRAKSSERREVVGAPLIVSSQLLINVSTSCWFSLDRKATRRATSARGLLLLAPA